VSCLKVEGTARFVSIKKMKWILTFRSTRKLSLVFFLFKSLLIVYRYQEGEGTHPRSLLIALSLSLSAGMIDTFILLY